MRCNSGEIWPIPTLASIRKLLVECVLCGQNAAPGVELCMTIAKSAASPSLGSHQAATTALNWVDDREGDLFALVNSLQAKRNEEED